MTTDRPLPAMLVVALSIAVAACTPAAPDAGAAKPSPNAEAKASSNAQPKSSSAAAWTLPAQAGMQPDLIVAPDGSLLLSWVEETNGRRSLHVARWQGTRWTPARTVATGDWFGNAFDTPQIEQTQDGALWATWMRSSPAGGHARDVVIARSADGGVTWSRPVPVNTDATATEHGFVSLWRAAPDAVGVGWLDGRAKDGRGHDMHGDDHAMQMLRATVFDARLRPHGEAAIDSTVCDCCHTAVAAAASGPVMVYRDRTAGEVRDIHAAVLRDGAWRETGAVHDDHWVMPGCPVNGPSVAASGDRVTAVWYTAPDGTPGVRYASSTDGGDHFGDADTLAHDAGVLGRVAVAADADGAWFGWLAEADGRQVLRIARRDGTANDAQAPRTLAVLGTHGNAAGMLRLVTANDATYAVWTDSIDGAPHLAGARL